MIAISHPAAPGETSTTYRVTFTDTKRTELHVLDITTAPCTIAEARPHIEAEINVRGFDAEIIDISPVTIHTLPR